MIKIRIPGELPKGGALKVTIFVGTLGFKRSEFLKEMEWRPGDTMYVDPETTFVSFESSMTPTKVLKRSLSTIRIPE
jgi:hypothetical protein